MNEYVYDIVKIPTSSPDDVSQLIRFLNDNPDMEVVAILGKTEGNGCINDFSRTLALTGIRRVLGSRAIEHPVLIMSGGTEGVLCPHLTVFVRRLRQVDDQKGPALVFGTAHTKDIDALHVGRMEQVHEVEKATRFAMLRAGISNPEDIHFVQVKCPLLSDEQIADAQIKNKIPVTLDSYRSMGYSRGASALGVALALGEVHDAQVKESIICRDWSIYSSVASVSSGAELKNCEVLVLGNSHLASGPLRIRHEVMFDLVDISSLQKTFADLINKTKGVGQVFAKADPQHFIRDRRTTMYSDSDIQPTRHARAALGGLLGGLFGETMIYVSGGAEHQGPRGGGPVAIVSER
jgi:cyanuric acid amidohydrolase